MKDTEDNKKDHEKQRMKIIEGHEATWKQNVQVISEKFKESSEQEAKR